MLTPRRLITSFAFRRRESTEPSFTTTIHFSKNTPAPWRATELQGKRRLPVWKIKRMFNQCKHSDCCTKTGVFGVRWCYDFCYKCNKFYSVCKDFEEQICERLIKPPYCCNGCSKTRGCHFRKKFYRANIAQNGYRHTVSESREGLYRRY